MRTPLVNIRSFAGNCKRLYALQKPSGRPAIRRCRGVGPDSEQINESLYFINARRLMQALIDGLLEISRIGTASVRFSRGMNRMLKHIVSSMLSDSAGRAAVAVESLPVSGRYGAAESSLYQSLDNALKYRDRPTVADAHFRSRDGNRCIYRVEDNGIGIARNTGKSEIFYRLTR